MICIFLALLFGIHSESNPDITPRKNFRTRVSRRRLALQQKDND